jgi:hypothetical protein
LIFKNFRLILNFFYLVKMAKQSVLYFYPERVAWIGASVLGAVFLLAAIYAIDSKPSAVSLSGRAATETSIEPFSFSLGLSGKGPFFPVPDLQGEMTFSFDPPRPSETVTEPRLLVRMKKSGDWRRVTLPCRLDLEIQRDKLVFAKDKSAFWVELAAAGNGQIEGKGYISSVEEGKIEGGAFLAAAQDCPIQLAQEFSEGSPFRLLAEGRWWGRDQFRMQYTERDSKIGKCQGGAQSLSQAKPAPKQLNLEGWAMQEDLKICGCPTPAEPIFESRAVCEAAGFAERLEVGSELLEIKEGDWLVWKDHCWQKSHSAEKEQPVAHIQSLTGKTLVLEGWDHEGHIRISLSPAQMPPFKMRGEELFTSIRIRSEKQISCMLEKQCMVLKAGDWVLKTGGRWKILRKEQEREAYLCGKLLGELFVFEQIHTKQGQKTIQGRLFNPGRTQAVSVELAAQSTRKRTTQKGKAQ